MEPRNDGSAPSFTTNFGGSTAGPLTPPTLPFRFGRDWNEQASPPAAAPASVPLRSARNPRPVRVPGSNTYRRQAPVLEPPFYDPGSLPRSGIQNARGMAIPRTSIPKSHGVPIPRAPGIAAIRAATLPRPSSMVFNRLSRPPATNVQRQPPPAPIQKQPSAGPRLPTSVTPPPFSRPKSPPLSLEDQERENLAKERRRDRFKLEQAATPIEPVVKVEPRRSRPVSESMEVEDLFSDDRDWKSAEPILGLCPDMCAETERAERERKGDLDQFERVDGDRNQTSASLAVKKYTRTAEKDANLIRPLSVLQSTMSYLLHLLDRSYGEGLLPLYNFLWDRMRAIRQDLRMQHIFNHEAIEMHEQMIRFHILAMHELCEYPKGEGFTEGFDAHLNIEQMNKTVVDLFLMYDAQRQQGKLLPNEPEFRGYYALLKLDKHPGYMVEPSELTADLAKMDPQLRNSTDVLFARKAATSYRLPNYIKFFRLARKATYLQACLMHAHFSKLRTQALALLHSGLKSSQGIPLIQLTSWLGMERQEMEELLEYHGFSIKQFEEPYMVKEGLFVSNDQGYRTSRSSLVETKRSSTIMQDVVARKALQADWSVDRRESVVKAGFVRGTVSELAQEPIVLDEKLPDYEDEEMEEVYLDVEDLEVDVPNTTAREEDASFHHPSFHHASFTHASFSSPPSPPFVPEAVVQDSAFYIPPPRMQETVSPSQESYLGKRQRQSETEAQEHSPKRREKTGRFGASPALEVVEQPDTEKEEALARAEEERLRQEEALQARTKLWFRRWKLRTDARIEATKLRQQKAQAALASMSLGLSLQTDWKVPRPTVQQIDLHRVTAQRQFQLDNLWTYLDIPSLIVPVYKEKHPQGKAICWKLALCSGVSDTLETRQEKSTSSGQWLRSKFFEDTPRDDASASAPETYVSKRVINDVYCCYIAKDVGFHGNEVKNVATLYGISAVVFLVREDLNLQDNYFRLQSLVRAVPSGTAVPLLLVSLQGGDTLLEDSLHLNRLDTSKISSWWVISITKDLKGFYSKEALVSGIQWLASLVSSWPDLRAVNLRQLVSEQLRRGLKLQEPGPSECILMFNRALENSVEELYAAARSCPGYWPPPEFGSAFEDWPLPSAGWNDPENLQPILDVLDWCRLPPFISSGAQPVVFSNATSSVKLLEDVKAEYKYLATALESYVRQIDQDEDPDQARAAAESMLADAVSLDWAAEQCRIVVDWLHVFGPIFQDRLMLLNSEPPATVYVLRKAGQEAEEADDYERQLNLATKLQGGVYRQAGDDVPNRLKEEVASYERQQQEQEELSTSTAFDDAELEKDADDDAEKLGRIIAQELEYMRSEEGQKLLSFGNGGWVVDDRAKPKYRPLHFGATDEEARLDVLVAKLYQKVNESVEEAQMEIGNGTPAEEESGSGSSRRAIGWEQKAAGVASNGNSVSSSSSNSSCERRFSNLVECCKNWQLSNYAKLVGYFGLTS